MSPSPGKMVRKRERERERETGVWLQRVAGAACVRSLKEKKKEKKSHADGGMLE